MGKIIVKTVPATEAALFELSLASANSSEKEIFIYEKYSLLELLGNKKAKEIRQKLIGNEIKVTQISNQPNLEEAVTPEDRLSEEFKEDVMSYYYVPENVLDIKKEMLIFDDTVATYTNEPDGTITIISDPVFARQQKQLFKTLINNESLPIVNPEYRPNHSFYNSIDIYSGETQIIVWPDADATESFAGFDEKQLGSYLKEIIEKDKAYYADASYIISFIWSFDGEKMVDMWKLSENPVDDRSGPFTNVKIYREGLETNELGYGSGNTLLVLGLEERLRRQSKSLQGYLAGNPPELPLDILNRKNFFEHS